MLNSKFVRAILIDPFAKTVEETTFNASNHRNIHKVLGVDTFDARILNRENSMFFDDEGLFKPDQHYFAMGGGSAGPFAGKALILGIDSEGETADCTLPLRAVKGSVRFYKVQPVFRDITTSEGTTELFGRPAAHIVQTAHFDPEGELE